MTSSKFDAALTGSSQAATLGMNGGELSAEQHPVMSDSVPNRQ